MPRPSPVNGQPMVEIDFLGVMLDVCPATGGVWFDQGELGRIRAASAEHFAHLDALAVPDPEKAADAEDCEGLKKMCPSCGIPLEPFAFMFSSPIILDTCNTCGGVFADEGELSAMHDFLAERAANRGLPAGTSKEVVERAALALTVVTADHQRAEQKAQGLCGIFRILSAPIRRRIL